MWSLFLSIWHCTGDWILLNTAFTCPGPCNMLKEQMSLLFVSTQQEQNYFWKNIVLQFDCCSEHWALLCSGVTLYQLCYYCASGSSVVYIFQCWSELRCGASCLFVFIFIYVIWPAFSDILECFWVCLYMCVCVSVNILLWLTFVLE